MYPGNSTFFTAVDIVRVHALGTLEYIRIVNTTVDTSLGVLRA